MALLLRGALLDSSTSFINIVYTHDISTLIILEVYVRLPKSRTGSIVENCQFSRPLLVSQREKPFQMSLVLHNPVIH